jgi:acetyl esterase/lipase
MNIGKSHRVTGLRRSPCVNGSNFLLQCMGIFLCEWVFLACALAADPGTPSAPASQATSAAPTASAEPAAPVEPATPGAKVARVPPTKSNVAYGTDPNQMLDLYLPQGTGPFPIVLFIHGGGWMNGDKVAKLIPANLQRLLSAGCAVVSINYRFIADAEKQGVFPPVLAPLNDAKRALQFVRYHAAEWNLDPKRVVVFGASAGAFSSLWLGLSPDMAEPGSADPVARMSSRVLAIGGFIAQTSIDPKQMREWVGPKMTYGGHAFGVPNFEDFLRRRDEFAAWYPKLSPASLVSADDPPVFLSYGQSLDNPNGPGGYTHSPRFGLGFQEVARQRGAVCYLQFPGHPAEGIEGDVIDFLIREVKK